MRIYLESLGCRLNYAEMAALARRLSQGGCELADTAADADVCILNSCSVTEEAARKSRQTCRQLAHANPDVQLVVTGCYATLEGETAATLPNVALVVNNRHKDELPDLLRGLGHVENRPGITAPSPNLGDARPVAGSEPVTGSEPVRTRAFIKVQEGCRNRCTYCIVAVARGEERSRPIAEVVHEIDDLTGSGCREAVLTGVHLGAYGRDNGGNLATLVAAVLEGTRIARLRLSSLEPFDLAADFFRLWPQSSGRLMPHLHLPAQSGSDHVLRRMARRNRVADYEALAVAARAAIPGVTLTTDLMAGFPGETESEFADTLAFASRLRFAHAHVFTYSDRPGTASAGFPDQVPQLERRRRAQSLRALDRELSRWVREQFLGDVRPVLWEQRGKARSTRSEGALTNTKDPAPDDPWTGLTDNYLRVYAVPPTGADLHNQIAAARLVRLADGALWAELAA